MLVELTVMEQRHQAVLEVLVQGTTVTEVASRYGVHRKSVHAWIRRYKAAAWRPWPTGRTVLAAIPGRSTRSSRRSSASCAGPIPAGTATAGPRARAPRGLPALLPVQRLPGARAQALVGGTAPQAPPSGL